MENIENKVEKKRKTQKEIGGKRREWIKQEEKD